MYRNDGSTIPLWTVDWNSRALVPAGGEYVVRLNNEPRWPGRYDDQALTFFSNGQPLKTYTTAELVDLPWLLPVGYHVGYDLLLGWVLSKNDGHAEVTFAGNTYANESVTFDRRNQTVELLTVLGDRLKFDLTTGELVSAKHPATPPTLIMFAFLLTGYAVFRNKYRGNGIGRPWIGPLNVMIGGLFTVALAVIPATAVWYFYVSDYPEHESYRYPVMASFETLPRYVVAFFGYRSGEFTYRGSWLVIFFWVGAIAVFTILDRLVVWIAERVRRPEIA